MYIKDLAAAAEQSTSIKGWVTNKRESKGIVFLVVRDGTGFCQCVIALENCGEQVFEQARSLSMESSVALTGKVVKDDKQIGGVELQVNQIEVFQIAEEYPISKKEHGVDFLMDHRHLWLRSSRQWAIMRIRNTIIYSIHKFFQEQGFLQMDAPIFTGNACEGTSNLFETDFYGDPAYLSQSGQLYGEAMAMAFGRIYTFGPTFRAEKSKTRRHLSEFWMIEPEMAFYDIFQNMDVIEGMLHTVIREVLNTNKAELELIGRDTAMLESSLKPFPRITYDEAVRIIKGEQDVNGVNSIASLREAWKETQDRHDAVLKDIEEREAKIATPGMKKGEIGFHQNKIQELRTELRDLEEDLRNIPQWIESAENFRYGNDFGGSDETVLTRLFDVPVMVYDWPHEVKAFYLKRSAQDSSKARGVDVLAPEGYGEIVGGGERETDLNLLKEKIVEHQLPMEAFEWYLDLRRFGSVPHSGFGLGLERLVTWVCKLKHVRESIPFGRMYGRLLP
jgi:asparaginyl-tRNA synthetase